MTPILSYKPRERVHVALMDFRNQPGMYEGKEMKWIINFVDHYSRRCFLLPLPSKGAQDIVGAFLEFICTVGKPVCFHTDNGSEFMSAEIKQVYKKFGIVIVHGRSCHPQSRGVVASHKRRVKQKLRMMVIDDSLMNKENPQANWPKHILELQYILNNIKTRGLKYTPMEVWHNETHDLSLIQQTLSHYYCHMDADGVYCLNPMEIKETDNAEISSI